VLGKLRDRQAAVPLIDCLRDEDSDVRGAAAEALGKLGDVRAVAPLSQLLDDKTRYLLWETISQVAQKALQAIGTPEALAALDAWKVRKGE
jgi:HEAT repeat protein